MVQGDGKKKKGTGIPNRDEKLFPGLVGVFSDGNGEEGEGGENFIVFQITGISMNLKMNVKRMPSQSPSDPSFLFLPF